MDHRREGPLAAAGYLALALLSTWPVVLDPAHRLAGHPEASAPCHVWVVWWAREHLGASHFTGIFHPYGADVVHLYGSDVLSPLLLAWLPASPVLAYNAWVVLLLTLGGLGAHRLAAGLGQPLAGRIVAGCVFATAPFLRHELFNGTSELLAAAALPWFAAALLGLFDRPSWRAGAWAGLLVGLGVAASAYNLFFLLAVALVVTVGRLVTRLEAVFDGAVLRASAVALGVAGLFGAPLAWLQLSAGAAETYARRQRWTDPDLALPDAFAELQMWFSPLGGDLPVVMTWADGRSYAYWTTATVYLGWVALGLAAWGLRGGRWRRGRRRRRPGAVAGAAPGGGGAAAGGSARRADGTPAAPGARPQGGQAPWGPALALLIVGVLLAMGPWVRWNGAPVEFAGHVLPLPGLVLADLLPPYVVTAVHAYRYAALAVLGLAVLAGHGARHPAWALAVVAESFLVAPAPWPVPTTWVPQSAVLEDLAALPPGAVLTLPMEADVLGDLGAMLLAQTTHGKPVQDGGMHERAGAAATRLYDEVSLLRLVSWRGGGELPGPVETRFGLGELACQGYRYLLVRSTEQALMGWAEEALGAPRARDGTWASWVLPMECAG